MALVVALTFFPWPFLDPAAFPDTLKAREHIDEASLCRHRSLETVRGNPQLFYELATMYALSAGLVGKSPTRLTPHQLEDRRLRFTQHGVLMLHEAIADDFRDLEQLCKDPQLAPLRNSPEFQVLVLDLQFPADAFATP